MNNENFNEMECFRMSLLKLRVVKEIIGDGNCFLRVVLFSFINFEVFYNVICNVVCFYMMKNE